MSRDVFEALRNAQAASVDVFEAFGNAQSDVPGRLRPVCKPLDASVYSRDMATEWMPEPLARLARESGAFDLSFPSEQDSIASGDALTAHYDGNWHFGVLWNDLMWNACRERARGLRLWAEAPQVRLANGLAEKPSLFFDPAEPRRLWYAPSTSLPAVFFVLLPATVDAVARALVELGPCATRPALAERRVFRAFMGNGASLRVPSPYSGELEEAGPHELDRHFNFSPTVTPHCWSTAYDDDPLRDQGSVTGVEMLAQALVLRKLREQLPGAWTRFTRRSYFSESQLSIEMHDQRNYYWHVEYRPATISRDTIAAFNELAGYRFPLDLPVDVASAMCGFDCIPLAELEALIAKETDPGRRAAAVTVALGIASDDLQLARRIAHAALTRGGDDLVAVANAAIRFNWESLLTDAQAALTDEAQREQVSEILMGGIAPPQLTEQGEPWDVYGDAGETPDGEDADDNQ